MATANFTRHSFKVATVLVLILFNTCPSPILGGRILLYPFAHCVNSHLLNMEKLASILLADGHDITMFVPTSYKGPYSYTDLSKVNFLYFEGPQHAKSICSFDSLDDFLDASLIEILKTFYRGTYVYCEKLIAGKQKLDLIKQGGFDLAIYDAVDQCSKILADYIDIPFIVFHTSGMESILPRNPAFLPSMMTSFTDEMNLPQRLANTMGYMVQKLIAHYTYNYYQDLRVHYNMNASLSVYNSFNRAAVRIILGEYGLDYVGPTRPNHITVGGFIHPEAHPIPTDLKQFLDTATDGVAVLSFGSIAREFGPKWRELFAEALSNIPMKVVWRFSEPIPHTLGNNTMIVPWFPQSEVLEHPNVRIFITHCGMNAAYEAAFSGVPVVAIPLFADQFFQASKLIKHVGMGVQLNIRSMDSQSLTEAIIQVNNNQNMHRNAQSISKIMKNRPISQKVEIQKWVSYTLFHGGASHLHSPEYSLEWYQYYLLDVLCVLVAISMTILAILCLILRCLFRYLKKRLLGLTMAQSRPTADIKLPQETETFLKKKSPHNVRTKDTESTT